jgi:hypothetical protein
MPNWELILHHTYAGTPGVAYDSSPRHGSHGRLQGGLNASAFVADGASPGSGAVNFLSNNGFHAYETIVVSPITDSWQPLEGLLCEIVCMFKPQVIYPAGGGNLLSSDLFNFRVAHYKFEGLPTELVAWVELQPEPAHPAWTMVVPETANPPGVSIGAADADEWVTVGFLYDGLSTVQISVNGAVVHESVMTLPRMGTPRQVRIGPIFGLIDDVKIWRLNPQRLTNNFLDRPIDSATANCVLGWLEEIRQVLVGDPQCARRLLSLLDDVLRAGLSELLVGDDATRQVFLAAAQAYQQAWSEGRFDDVAAIVTDLTQRFSGAFTDNDFVNQLLDDPCANKILSAIPPLTCDPQLSALATGIAAATPIPGRA